MYRLLVRGMQVPSVHTHTRWALQMRPHAQFAQLISFLTWLNRHTEACAIADFAVEAGVYRYPAPPPAGQHSSALSLDSLTCATVCLCGVHTCMRVCAAGLIRHAPSAHEGKRTRHSSSPLSPGCQSTGPCQRRHGCWRAMRAPSWLSGMRRWLWPSVTLTTAPGSNWRRMTWRWR